MSETPAQPRNAMGANAFPRDKDAMGADGPKPKGRKRRKVSYLTLHKIDFVDYKEVNILRRFTNDRGKILPARQSGNTAKQQRMIARAIHRAREMALLPFVAKDMSADRRDFGPRRERTPYTPRHERNQEQAPAPAEAPAAE